MLACLRGRKSTRASGGPGAYKPLDLSTCLASRFTPARQPCTPVAPAPFRQLQPPPAPLYRAPGLAL